MFSVTIGGLPEGSPQCGRHACHPSLLRRLHVGGYSGIQFIELHHNTSIYTYKLHVGGSSEIQLYPSTIFAPKYCFSHQVNLIQVLLATTAKLVSKYLLWTFAMRCKICFQMKISSTFIWNLRKDGTYQKISHPRALLSCDARSTDFAFLLQIGEMAIQRIVISPVKGSQNVNTWLDAKV